MGKCGRDCQSSCFLCPFKPKVGCCELIEFTDRGLRMVYFAALLLQKVVPGWDPKLSRFVAFTCVARDLTEAINCLRDFQDLTAGELFDSECKADCAQLLDRCASGIGLMSSGFTLAAILHDYGLPLGDWSPRVEKLARAVNATGHITVLVAVLTDRALADETDGDECWEATKQVVFRIAEASHQALVEGLAIDPLPLRCGIAMVAGAAGMVKVATDKVATEA